MFFYLSKAIGFLVLPSSLIALSLAAAFGLAVIGWAKAARRLLAGGLIALVGCGLLPLGDLLTIPLETRFSRPDLTGPDLMGRRVATIIVLGGAEETSPRELMGLNEAGERMTEAVALARRHPEVKLLFSGGSAAVVRAHSTGAADARRLFESLGVPADQIVLEDRSRTTWENAVETCRLLGCGLVRQTGRHLLVTSAWHMPRAIGAFRAAGLPVEPWPVDYRAPRQLALRISTIPEGLRRIDMIAREYIGLVAYRLTGRSSALLPGP